MTGAVIKLRSAARDLDENAEYLQNRGGPKYAIRFLRNAEATFQRLATLPNMGAAFEPGEPRFAGLRYCPVARFKSYVVFYRQVPEGIEVLRVLHGSRDLQGLLASDPDDGMDDEEAPEVE